MDTKKKYQNVLAVMVKTYKNGPYSPVHVTIDLEDFINAPSQKDYIFKRTSLCFMGGDDITVEYCYSVEEAKMDLDILKQQQATH